MREGHFLRVALAPGEAVRHWQLGEVGEARYDIADQPMAGAMDPFFFLSRHKNFIPHEYPCRTAFAAEHRGKRPAIAATLPLTRWWLPFGSPRVDLSGFWFRPTRIACLARTCIEAETAGTARVRLGTCGGAILFLDGKEIGWLASYSRNLEAKEEFDLPLKAGLNEVEIHFDDLAERDARFFFQLDYLGGPAARVAMPIPVEKAVAGAIETILGGMRFDRTAYFGGDVAILFPAPLPIAVLATIAIDGDFMSGEDVMLEIALAAGAIRIDLGPADDLPADFRHYHVTLDVGGFVASQSLGVEICPIERQGEAPVSLEARIGEALDAAAEFSERDTVRAFARLALGRAGAETDAMISDMLPMIDDCHDCSDFVLVPLIWARSAWGDGIDEAVRQRIDRTILGYRYWLDEPGNDVQWYFSENHALLFHTAAYLAGTLLPDGVFTRSGRKGREQAKIGEARVRAWLDHFETWEMAEFNSAPYFPIDLKGLTALAALAPDADIKRRAANGVVRLLEIVARSAHQGLITAAQGRSYEHTLRPGRSLELSAIARLVWGKGWYGRRFHALPLLAVLMRDYGLAVPEELAGIASHSGEDALEWRFAQGENNFAALYHYKTRNYAMGSAVKYRWGEWGYQETVLHLRLGDRPEAQIWINHPGETIQSGHGRPSFWGGSGTLPRVQQYRGLAVLEFSVRDEQPDFTHAWFPAAEFDAVRVEGNRASARGGDGLALLVGSRPFELAGDGPAAGVDLRLPGRKSRWIVRLSDGAREADGMQRFAALKVESDADGSFFVDDPDYGRVIFHASGVVEAEGRRLDPAEWTIQGQTTRLVD